MMGELINSLRGRTTGRLRGTWRTRTLNKRRWKINMNQIITQMKNHYPYIIQAAASVFLFPYFSLCLSLCLLTAVFLENHVTKLNGTNIIVFMISLILTWDVWKHFKTYKFFFFQVTEMKTFHSHVPSRQQTVHLPLLLKSPIFIMIISYIQYCM